jgi:hypothetical protein
VSLRRDNESVKLRTPYYSSRAYVYFVECMTVVLLIFWLRREEEE